MFASFSGSTYHPTVEPRYETWFATTIHLQLLLFILRCDFDGNIESILLTRNELSFELTMNDYFREAE